MQGDITAKVSFGEIRKTASGTSRIDCTEGVYVNSQFFPRYSPS
jgi:hypothetical protein